MMLLKTALVAQVQRYSMLYLAIAASGAAVANAAVAQSAADEPVVITEYLVIPRVGSYGRTPLHVDPVHAMIASETWETPAAGERFRGVEQGAILWKQVEVGDSDWVVEPELYGGYANAQVDRPEDEVMLLEASGHAMVYVNGAPRAGDPYQTEKTILPVRLQAGKNELLFHVAAGKLRTRLLPVDEPVSFDTRDMSLPDLVIGEQGIRWLGVLIVNARPTPMQAGQISAVRAEGDTMTSEVGPIPPMTVRKVPVPIDGTVTAEEGPWEAIRVRLDLTERQESEKRKLLASTAFDLAVVSPTERHTRTFVSRIDGSVQSYCVLPATTDTQGAADTPPGLLVALHDRGESATDHLKHYQPKPWAHILAPQGRRPHGFDWEEWSAIDVQEAIQDVATTHQFDPQRKWLIGQATGGHGVWNLATAPEHRWAAVCASNGWVSYHSYGQSLPQWNSDQPIEEILQRGLDTLDLRQLLPNLGSMGVYVHHDPQAEVPIDQGQEMRDALAEFHPNFAYRELPFPSADREPLCCDWPPVMDFFQSTSSGLAKQAEEQVDYVSFFPTKINEHAWASIQQQQVQLSLSHVRASRSLEERVIRASMSNVRKIAFDVSRFDLELPVRVYLDGEAMGPILWPTSDKPHLIFQKTKTGWQEIRDHSSDEKQPGTFGLFKQLFDRRVLLVYGTQGNAEENRWAFTKARFDAEMFLVRANGAIEVIDDESFRREKHSDRNVILYGNADTNSAWPQLLSTSPIQVRRGTIRFGLRPETGDDLACLLVRPHPSNGETLVGAVSGTGSAGFRATDRVPYFVSGVMVPDLVVFSAKALRQGTDDLRALGFFGADWSLEEGEFAWRDMAL